MADPTAARRSASLVRNWAAASFALDARSLAAFRIGLGCILVADCLLRTRDFGLMFAPDGVFPPEALARFFHGQPACWSVAFLNHAPWWGGVVLAIEGLAGAALAVGWQTRLATILAWVALVSVLRRTAPATNAGDTWLACQLFWSMFLPLGARWSLDAARSAAVAPPTPRPAGVCSVASAALVLQLVAVYFAAGLSKCNASWLAGDALSHALSVHDHGTPVGTLLSRLPGIVRPLQWAVPAGELVLPLALVARPAPALRGAIVAVFLAFHAMIWLAMTVGLFAAIGIVAWLPLIPGRFWPATTAGEPGRLVGLGRAASWSCGLAGVVALGALVHEVTPGRTRPLPDPLATAVNLACLPQEWAMFGGVPAQEQWVYGRAVLADGDVVDLLRDGRPLERERPEGGFMSLPHHRWHKFFWVLPQPRFAMFAAPTAAALARDWNARHGPDRQVVSLEIRFAFQGVEGASGTLRDVLIASWPSRSPAGSGNLERFLQATATQTVPPPSAD